MNIALLKRIILLSTQLAESPPGDVDRVITKAVNQTRELIGAELCHLILIGQDGTLDFRATSSIIDDETHQDQDDISLSILTHVIQNAQALVLPNALTDEIFGSKASILGLKIRSVMCVPLLVQGEVIGALYVENRSMAGVFDDEDVEPLRLFANYAAVTIENTRILAGLEERVAERTVEVELGWKRAMEANRLRTIVLSQLAHDMRSPIMVIDLSLKSLQKYSDFDAQQIKWLTRAIHSSQHLFQLANKASNLNKNESAFQELCLENVDLREYLLQLYDLGSGLPWQEDVKFDHAIPDTLPMVKIDVGYIQQVIINLIENALKYTQRGKVTFYAIVDDFAFVQIGVRDTGVGIPVDAQGHVFERFYQVQAAQTHQLSGVGFGLSICKELVELHGGTIWIASSVPGVGSDFVFTVPIAV